MFQLPRPRRSRSFQFIGHCLALAGGLSAADPSGASARVAPAALRIWPNLADNIERPLRYRPDGVDFVIENGAEFFNRPLYGGNTAFRVDAGDRPEFVLYLPGRGGNLRLGLRGSDGSAKWLHGAESVVARYRPGSMRYEIRDPLLGDGHVLELTALALHQTDGLIVQAELRPSPPAGGGLPGRTARNETATACELVFAFGGVTGQRGRRDGDIGTENVPISEWFQLRPEYCREQQFELEARAFTLRSRPATIVGHVPAGTRLAVADAGGWDSCPELLRSADFASGGAAGSFEAQVVAGRVALSAGAPLLLALQRVSASGTATTEELGTYRAVTAPQAGRREPAAPVVPLLPAFSADELPGVFAASEAHFTALRRQVAVNTPDPFLNAAVAALNVAADAVWDEPEGVVMHGAIAWRSKLLGWRGPYAMDALGWHGRARRHFAYWATRQNTGPVPEKIPPPDENANLARSEAALHSNGDMSNSHYDMNLVYIDALLRHLRWTGDLGFAREVWPVIERHLAWERRLFRREFTTAAGERLPLYEAYAAIWASDDLQYHGGGTAHASAYNLLHHREAARLAPLLGVDGAPYAREAELIARGMRELLWIEDAGAFAEFKDLLGLQLVHPSAALWSVYHTIDSEVTSPAEALRLTRYVENRLPWLPVRGAGVPDDASYGVFASTDWMPYTWSINNVVMGENIHTALAFWQAGRPDAAFVLTKSALLASMFMGICPGNVGSMNYLDVHRRESQRDFADGSGVLARALVEGLFGIRPDALEGVLRVQPGFPAHWDRASISTPDVTVAFERVGAREVLRVEPRAAQFAATEVELPARGRTLLARRRSPTPRGIQFEFDWSGPAQAAPAGPAGRPRGAADLTAPAKDPVRATSLHPLDLTPHFNDRVTEIFRPGKYRSPRSPFCSLALPAQGIGAWAGHVNASAEIDDSGLRRVAGENGGRIALPGGVFFHTPGPGGAPNVVFVSQWDNYPHEATIALGGKARRLHLLLAGSTNHMQSRLDNGEVIASYADGTSARLALRNPETWWPIEQDYFVDDFQFRLEAALPVRVDLKSGVVRVLDPASFKGKGGVVPGGAATVLELPLDAGRELRSLTVRALANEIVVGLMAATLER